MDYGDQFMLLLHVEDKHDSDGMGHHKWSPTGYGIVEDV
jgi:hypothetical protein